ncbi:hypothetical protein [Bacillus pinisoli]|uniref:hypothetical protein n=1 Tax=Bacillus pinisoli TaxID=2901866 RepID=UPI001FF38EB0|nr:hypothetical protein [Bacillus pinisoli]
MDKIKPEVILEVGAEGGSITLFGFERNGNWYFTLKTNEGTMLDFLEEEESVDNLVRNSRLVEGIEKGLALLDYYLWTQLNPRKIHKNFGEFILNEFKKRRPSDPRLIRWERAFEKSKLFY